MTRSHITSLGVAGVLLVGVAALAACQTQPLDPQAALVAKGRVLFFTETFNGNGRTCGSCHREENNFTIDPVFIATLPKNDALFVAEFNPALKQNFENPRLMREFGLILENLDGFGDLANRFTMRGVPHVLALPTSVASPQGPRTGWSGDGAPADGSLRSFATGAVIQHFTRTLNRVAEVDFRLPTEAELDALEAFQLSLGRQSDLQLPLPLKGTVAKRGQEIFHNNGIQTIEGAVAFYNGQAFNNSPSGRFLASTDPNRVGIRLDATQVVAVAAFLRVINALENIRQSVELLTQSAALGFFERAPAEPLLKQAVSETSDSIRVLSGGGLHPEAVARLVEAQRLAERAASSLFNRRALTREAITAQELARSQLIEVRK